MLFQTHKTSVHLRNTSRTGLNLTIYMDYLYGWYPFWSLNIFGLSMGGQKWWENIKILSCSVFLHEWCFDAFVSPLYSPRHPACVSKMHSLPHKVKGKGDALQILGSRRIISPISALEPSPGSQKRTAKPTKRWMELKVPLNYKGLFSIGLEDCTSVRSWFLNVAEILWSHKSGTRMFF